MGVAGGSVVQIAARAQRPALEGAREHDLRLGREDVGHGLDLVQDPLQVAGVGGSHLEEIVRLARDVVAFFDFDDLAEVAGQVSGDRARNLLDEYESQNAVPEQRRIDQRRVAADDAAPFELLDPLVGGRPAHTDGLPNFGVGLAPVALEQFQDPSVGLVDPFE